MSNQIRGRKTDEIIVIDKDMIDNSICIPIFIQNREIEFFVPTLVDYLIMKIISGRASDIRDIASIILENKIPKNIKKRVYEIAPKQRIFEEKLKNVIIPEIKNQLFLDSWKGVFATTGYTEDDKKKVLRVLKKLM